MTKRMAHCQYGCGNKKESSTALPFFESRPDDEEDRYYCGCYGWD